MNNILIVEDDPPTLEALTTCFDRSRYTVVPASGVKQALASLDTFRPDVLISDWQLGDVIDGVDLAQAVSTVVAGLNIIFITGHKTELVQRKAHELNVHTIIRKPFELRTIREAVEHAIAERHQAGPPTSGAWS